ncbi:MAG: efflux RND transporter permease subunit, partial [Chloroflexota bacterium]|nr:efflux RND transporter permease subunit [Chloroflexota bacterium]
FVQAMLPSGATLEQTEAVLDKVRLHFEQNEKDGVESILTVAGFSFSGQGQNMAFGFINLKDWDQRQRADLHVKAITGRAMRAFSQIKEGMVFAFPPPAVIELGQASGFDLQLQDRGDLGHAKLMAARNQLYGMAAKDPRLVKVRPNGMQDVPEYRVDVDWNKAGALGIPIASIHNTIAAAFGSAYVNDFIQAGRVKRVFVQADAPYRMLPHDIDKLYVRNKVGKMVPFSAFASGRWTVGSPKLERYNAFPSINFWGEPAPGISSGEAMQAMEELISKLPQGIGYDWTGLSYQERQAGSQAPLLYAFSIFVIFLCLAALYESWPIPIAILLTLPLGVIGGVIASSMRGMPNDIYFQIGLLITLGLTTKNAILIVQFARARVDAGIGLVDATLEAAKLRLRPIIMTSLAFGFGVLPLALSTGAGSGAQRAIGTGVMGGVVTSTFLVILFAPLFYVMIYKAMGKHRKTVTMKRADESTAGGQTHE